MNTVHDIIKNSLCLGCGLCEALDKENCKMVINQEGFYEPIFRDQHRIDHKVITKICPGIVVHSQVTNQSIWGNVKIVANAWASDSEIRSEDRYFDESITWSGVTSSQTGFRYSPQGAIFDSGANGLFAQKAEIVKYTLGFLNTKLVVDFVKCVNPTINTGSGTIGKLPLCIKDSEIEKVNLIVEECIENSRSDWDSFETSWDFTTHPLVNMSKGLWDATATAAAMDYFYGYLPEASCPLEICYLLWQGQCKERFEKLKANEEELNRIFIDIYGLQDELTPDQEPAQLCRGLYVWPLLAGCARACVGWSAL